jgi:hypothetical protein
MFTLSASAFQALSHTQVALFFPELALTADSKTLLIDMLLDFLKAISHPMSHRLGKFNWTVHIFLYPNFYLLHCAS